MKFKTSPAEISFDIFNHILMLFLAFITLYPMYFVAISSISSGSYVARGEVSFWPLKPTLASYAALMKDYYFLRSLLNTVVYTITGTAVNLFMSAICAYPLSIKTFSGKIFFMRMIMITMFFSGGMIPGYLLVRSLGFINTIWALILPGAISTFNMIIMRTFFQGIPGELREATIVDGANDLTILFRIFLPLSIPVMGTMTLFYATGHWNGFFSALLYITDKIKYPVQLILRNMLIDDQMSEHNRAIASEFEIVPLTLKYASIMISTIPILMVYPFIQKHFVKGVMIGSLKG